MNLLKKQLFINLLFFFFSISLIVSSVFFSTSLSAQTLPEMIDFNAHCIKGGKSLSLAEVKVYRRLAENVFTKPIDSTITTKNGKVHFQLPFGYDYKVSFHYPGCVNMYLLVLGKTIPRSLTTIYPTYSTEVPFSELTDPTINIEKYKNNPFTKVIFDGNKSVEDDQDYISKFTKNMILDETAQAKILQDKLKKEREEKDKQIAEKQAKDKADAARALADKQARDKMDAEQKRKFDAEVKALALQKAKEDSLARIKEEEDAKLKKQKESMETEAQRLKREQEEKALAEKKNKDIKTTMENDLLKAAAENERNAKEKAFKNQFAGARANTVIEQMKRDAELKSEQEKLVKEKREKDLQAMLNQQSKYNEVKKIVVAAAAAEKAIKVTKQKGTPDVKNYTRRETPKVKISEVDGFFRDIRTTTITYDKQNDIYRKERTLWGTVHYYKNDKEIDEIDYEVEINFYLSYANK